MKKVSLFFLLAVITSGAGAPTINRVGSTCTNYITADSSAVIHVFGGSFNPVSTLYIANDAGLTPFLNINGDRVTVPGTMNMHRWQ